MLVLSRSEVTRLLRIDEVINAVEAAHAALSSGAAHELGAAHVTVPSSSALLIPMVAALPTHAGGVKLLTDTPDNPTRSRPTQQSTVILVDTATGACEAFLDGAAITLYRTAAASAIASKYLAREDSTVVGFVGAGALARTHLLALRRIRPISRVLVWSRSRETARRFARDSAEDSLTVEIAPSPEAVVSRCDILCTLTPSRTPVVKGRWFRPGLHVNAVGAPPRREYREIDSEGIVRSRVVVDSFRAAVEKSGDVLIPFAEGAISEDHFREELGLIVLGERAGRTAADEITLYNSLGIAAQDIATASLVVERARRMGIGTEIALAS